ncbi:flagellin [Paracoccaceae bacterium]|nr:flagellin [Paracoccaceae bacterium]
MGTNTAALTAAKAITMSQRSIETSMERLSTGKRLNSAADDAAGVAITSRLTSNLKGINQSIRNAMDAQALIDTAEGGLQETEALLQRIRELAVQAASDTNSSTDRAALDAEKTQLMAEIDRIATSTTWAGQNLLDGTFSNKSFQVGGGTMAMDSLSSSIDNMSALGLGLNTNSTPEKVGTEFQINAFSTGNQGPSSSGSSSQAVPAVTSLKSGFLVTWSSEGQDGDRSGVFAQLLNSDGDKVGSEFQVNSFSAGNQYMPDVMATNDGGFIITWRSANLTSDPQILASRYDGNGQKIVSEFQVNTSMTGSQISPRVNVLSDDSYIITWSSTHAGNYEVYGQLFNSSNQKVGNEFQVNTYSTDNQYEPDVTVLEDDTFVVSWTSNNQDSGTIGVYGQHFDKSASKIGSEFRINSTSTGSQLSSRIEALSNGGFIASWTTSHDYGLSVYAQIFDANANQVGGEFRVNTSNDQWEVRPDIASLADGSFIVVWEDQNGDANGYAVKGQRYDINGTALGSEFSINSYENGDQYFASVTSSNDGQILVTWVSEGQDGDGQGIFAQRLTISSANLNSQSSSLTTLSTVDTALQTLNSQRASLGALSNRIDHIVTNNTNTATNIARSISRIEDADFAAETTNLAKQQILQQAATAMLAQANASKQNILTLLNL